MIPKLLYVQDNVCLSVHEFHLRNDYTLLINIGIGKLDHRLFSVDLSVHYKPYFMWRWMWVLLFLHSGLLWK
jgi:hypothetical protein